MSMVLDHKPALNAVVDLPVGTILKVSGVCEQTNARFYKVVNHFGRLGMVLVEVATKRDDTRIADPAVLIGNPFKAHQVDKNEAKFGRNRAFKQYV